MAVTLLPSSSSSESVWIGKQPPPPALYCSLMAWREEGGGRWRKRRGKGVRERQGSEGRGVTGAQWCREGGD